MLGSKIKRSQPSLPPNVASPTESPCKYTSAETQPFSADLKKWKWVEGRQFDECVCGDSPNPCDGKSLSALLCLVSFGAFEEWSCCSVLCVSFLWGSTLYNKYAIYTYMYVYVCIYIYVYIWDVYPISPLICFLRNSNWLLWFCYEKTNVFFWTSKMLWASQDIAVLHPIQLCNRWVASPRLSGQQLTDTYPKKARDMVFGVGENKMDTFCCSSSSSSSSCCCCCCCCWGWCWCWCCCMSYAVFVFPPGNCECTVVLGKHTRLPV